MFWMDDYASSKQKRPPRYTDPTIPQKHLAFLNFEETETIEIADCSAVFQSLTEVLKDDIKFNYGMHHGSILFIGQLIDFCPFGVCRVSIEEVLHDLVATPDNPCQGFVEGMGVIISSKYPKLVDKALGAVSRMFSRIAFPHRLELIQGGLVPTVISALQPRLMEPVHKPLYHEDILMIIDWSLDLTSPAPSDVTEESKLLPKGLVLDSVYSNVIHPMQVYLRHFCDNLEDVMKNDVMSARLSSILSQLLRISGFHSATMKELDISQISHIISLLLSSPLASKTWGNIAWGIIKCLPAWREEGSEAMRAGRIVFQQLFDDGFLDFADQRIAIPAEDRRGNRIPNLSMRLLDQIGGHTIANHSANQ
ncbi:hypothetical protein BLNAU_4344 [Blattamonas nauphoetae]|uniref:Uncharacterized protein n=1 Tax=Blattamonas nauphoetae TaxID=2049346 RepID=A0ABQ9YAF3_9EUKA|nr:hypothetical protein BLNAU_4344 [Blattamonas nauphoetae]